MVVNHMLENHDDVYAWAITDEDGPTAYGSCAGFSDAMNEGYRYLCNYMYSQPNTAFRLEVWRASNPADLLMQMTHFP